MCALLISRGSGGSAEEAEMAREDVQELHLLGAPCSCASAKQPLQRRGNRRASIRGSIVPERAPVMRRASLLVTEPPAALPSTLVAEPLAEVTEH